MRMAWHLRPRATTLRIWPSASVEKNIGGRRKTDTEPGLDMKDMVVFYRIPSTWYSMLIYDSMLQKIMPGIISTIQWGNNPWCHDVGYIVNKHRGSRSTISSVSDPKKQLGQVKEHRGTYRNMMINQKPPLVTIHLWTERGVNPDKTFWIGELE